MLLLRVAFHADRLLRNQTFRKRSVSEKDKAIEMRTTRRELLKAGAKIGTAAAAASLAGARHSLCEGASAALQQFAYGDVALLDGPMKQQFDANHAFFLALDEDKLLKPFRERAGLPAPGEDMGGWYDNSPDFNPHGSFHGFIPGHSFGQYLSGLARAYAITGSAATQAKVKRLVWAFTPTVCSKFYDGYHLPAYTYDKTNCGLMDAHRFADDPMALAVLNAATDAVLPHLPAKALARREQYALPHKDEAYCWDETYTLPENFFLAYANGGGERYRALAIRFLEDDFYFDPLSEGRNVLPGEHAYSHVNALSSAMQAYLTLGSEKHLSAARNGFEFVRAQSFATGGWGPNETFRAPGSGEVGESLKQTHASFETPCGAYGHFKITRYLLRVTRDSRYGDSMERVLYNTILAAKPLKEDGSSFYYSDYNSRAAHKVYHGDKWPCCSGTFPQITADYGISSYFHDADGVYVNFYAPSRVAWQRGGERVSLTQRTNYPNELATVIEVGVRSPAAFAIHLRIPAWTTGTTVAINGRTVAGEWKPGSFARVAATWKNGDRLEVGFSSATTLEAVDPEHPLLVAPLHGPLALFAVGQLPERLRREDLLRIAQTARGSENWQAQTGSGAVRFKTFPSIGDEEYRLYHPLES
jgi:uncharacterized protein